MAGSGKTPRQYKKKGMTRAAYARRRGCSEAAVHYASKKGYLVLYSDNSINPEASDVKWDRSCKRLPAQVTDPNPMAAAIARTLESEPQDTKTAAQIDHERLKIQKTKITIDKLRGTLVERELAEKVLYAVLRPIRESAMAIPARLANELCAISDASEIRSLLDREIRDALDLPDASFDELLKQAEGVKSK
jgi:hypothetical protein